ncbi:hypothetical protein C8R46DRAFT_1239621 [Mycena filopes]|nr:hypothetical protein C8R46DRAFT_1239621 [Mycena filopes]
MPKNNPQKENTLTSKKDANASARAVKTLESSSIGGAASDNKASSAKRPGPRDASAPEERASKKARMEEANASSATVPAAGREDAQGEVTTMDYEDDASEEDEDQVDVPGVFDTITKWRQQAWALKDKYGAQEGTQRMSRYLQDEVIQYGAAAHPDVVAKVFGTWTDMLLEMYCRPGGRFNKPDFIRVPSTAGPRVAPTFTFATPSCHPALLQLDGAGRQYLFVLLAGMISRSPALHQSLDRAHAAGETVVQAKDIVVPGPLHDGPGNYIVLPAGYLGASANIGKRGPHHLAKLQPESAKDPRRGMVSMKMLKARLDVPDMRLWSVHTGTALNEGASIMTIFAAENALCRLTDATNKGGNTNSLDMARPEFLPSETIIAIYDASASWVKDKKFGLPGQTDHALWKQACGMPEYADGSLVSPHTMWRIATKNVFTFVTQFRPDIEYRRVQDRVSGRAPANTTYGDRKPRRDARYNAVTASEAALAGVQAREALPAGDFGLTSRRPLKKRT